MILKVGVFLGLIQWVNDLETISHANNEYQWLLSYVLVTSIAIVSIGSMFLLASGPVGILAGIGLMVLLNVIKSMALKQIFMVRSRNRRYIG